MLYEIEEFRESTMNDDYEIQRPSSGEKVSFEDFCRMIPYQIAPNQFVQKCLSGSPIEFIYELATNSYPIEKYATDEELLD